jgi:ABC-2 type transport system permease protein
MNYYKQVLTVGLWEYKRFFKVKNELISIVVMAVLFGGGFLGGRLILRDLGGKQSFAMVETTPASLQEYLRSHYDIQLISPEEEESFRQQIMSQKEGMLLQANSQGFELFAYKKPSRFDQLRDHLNAWQVQASLQEKQIEQTEFAYIMRPAEIQEQYVYQSQRGQKKTTGFFFAGLLLMAVFMSFAYQFTAITGEKQLRITEQIVSAIKPQVWMDGKIFGITLTGLSSLITYSVLSILGGMLFFQVSGSSVARIQDYIHAPALGLFFVFTLMGILMWNSLLAAIASVITDPNNSGKGSLMMLPLMFVIASVIVIAEPDSNTAIFLSWFPLTSASAMPIRWLSTELAWWQVAGSFVLLTAAFHFFRKLAAKIFRVTILISGQEPSWGEVFKMMKES